MFTPSHLKSLHPLQIFSPKSSSSTSTHSSNLSSMKLKRIIHTLLVSHFCRIFRALSKLKHFIIEILKDTNNNSTINFTYYSSHKKRNNIRKKIILGSFRLHYNWCSSKSSHVLPVPDPLYENPDANLAGYLEWLEEKKIQEGVKEKEIVNEKEKENIDMLAEMFIANCHEKFKLEKQESDRRYQEMLARSM
ncbi:uncharacterized protein LOC131625354 [Vicia villosa]|uniref:uncharacterized protein LOC131621517 n=1 Tax=Vicia villosa TaxID=3911 RepID=UPI00273CD698|nr:uncharacterized protein LOC131621517 [Vicia villosa]XP_058752204.1 uncharacterized protein LOC131625354 [Vicia villosa]